jgi:hypothetical protein
MSADLSWKKFEFITTVQTGLISNGINHSIEKDAIDKRAEVSPATMVYQMNEAFRAAEMIPESVTARVAAWEFIMWTIHGETDPSAEMPEWFGPPSQQDYDRWIGRKEFS